MLLFYFYFRSIFKKSSSLIYGKAPASNDKQ